MATYRLENGHWVASSRGAWIPGTYDTESTARSAFRLDDAVLRKLSDRICRVDGENRPITKDDLREARNRPTLRPEEGWKDVTFLDNYTVGPDGERVPFGPQSDPAPPLGRGSAGEGA